jgi:hypothetical protein
VIEVKGNCTGEDLKKAKSKAAMIQALQGQDSPQYGLVCYKVALEEKTIEYPELDFFVSLEENKKLFLRRYEVSPGKFRFIRAVQSPLIRELFSMTRSLWIPAHQHAAR